MPSNIEQLGHLLKDEYLEDDYIPSDSIEERAFEKDMKKAISVLEKQSLDQENSPLLNISENLKNTEVENENANELYLKKVNLYRCLATKDSKMRRSIENDLDTLSSNLVTSKQRWSSQTEVNEESHDLGSHDAITENTPTHVRHSDSSTEPLSKLRTSVSSQSLQTDARSSTLSSRTLSSSSLQQRRLNKSNASVDSNSSLPDGWEKVDGPTGVYFWHIPSGTTQYQHPNLYSSNDLSERVGCLQISIPETAESLENQMKSPLSEYLLATSPEYCLSSDQHKVMNLGWMDMSPDVIKGSSSSVAINECIRKLCSLMQDPQQMEDSVQILKFEGTYLKLLHMRSGAVLFKQDILSIKRWGVGSDDVRDFAYVVKQKQASAYRCYVLRCDTPASVIALRMKSICSQAALKRKDTMEDCRDSSVDAPSTPISPLSPAEKEEDVKRFDILYLGYIRVEKEKGADIIHSAIEKLAKSYQSNWEAVTMEIHISTINLIKTSDRTLLAEHRVRFISFMALGTEEQYLGYIVHGGPRIFYCHVYQSDGSCADIARAIQTACNARYQLLLAKQEERKKCEKVESQGILSFFKKFKKKTQETSEKS